MKRVRLNFWTASCSVAAILFGLASPACLMRAIDDGLTAGDFDKTLLWSVLAACSQIFCGWLDYAAKLRANREALALESSIRQALFRRATGASLESLTDEREARWPGQILTAASSYNLFLQSLYTSAIPIAVSGVGTFFVLLTLSWSLAIASFALIPVCGGILLALRKPIREGARGDLEAWEALYGELSQDFASLVPLRALGKGAWMRERFGQCCARSVLNAGRLFSRLSVQSPIFDSFQALVWIAIFGIGGWYVTHGDATVGVVVGFQFYLARIFSLMRRGATFYSALHGFYEGRLRAQEILGLEAYVEPKFGVCGEGCVLEIEHLNFSFGEHALWQDYSLTIREGERKCILSHSGSGKTTLARLILGLYEPESGKISLAGGTSSSVGYVPQENFLTSGTLRENVEFLSGPLEDVEYLALIDICGLKALSERLGEKQVGVCGGKLSGGEQRRVMLARALATSPKLLIIDQMTSELEPALCESIFSSLGKRRAELSILYLGHRAPFEETREVKGDVLAAK